MPPPLRTDLQNHIKLYQLSCCEDLKFEREALTVQEC